MEIGCASRGRVTWGEKGFYHLWKIKKRSQGDRDESDSVVPAEGLAEIGDGEDRKYREGDDFLDGLKLGAVKFVGTNAIRRNLKAILKKSDAPARDDRFPKWSVAILQVAVPGEGHKNI